MGIGAEVCRGRAGVSAASLLRVVVDPAPDRIRKKIENAALAPDLFSRGGGACMIPAPLEDNEFVFLFTQVVSFSRLHWLRSPGAV